MLPHAHGGHTSSDRHEHTDHQHMDSHGEDAEHTQEGIWLGLVALGGIYFFFLTERLMGIISKWRRDVRKKKKVILDLALLARQGKMLCIVTLQLHYFLTAKDTMSQV